MVALDESPDLVYGLKVLEHSVLEDSVELVLEGGNNGTWFKTVDADGGEVSVPIEVVEVEETSAVKYGTHASVDFSRTKVVIYG